MPRFPINSELSNIEDVVQYFFLIDSLNFKFWHDNKNNYNYKGIVDSAALFRAIDDNLWLLDAKRMSEINDEKMKEVFHDIPMINKRKEILNNNGNILTEKYKGKAINILESGNYEIPKILDLLAEIPAFCDIYKEHIFMKRAQLFLAMVHGNTNLLKGIEELTVYADYQIPKLFEYLEIFKYSEELQNKINNSEFIDSGSEEELAIRSNTIQVGELLSNILKYPNAYLDYLLWSLGKDVTNKKFHYTRTIWY